jgi:hypothetical protein
VDHGVDDLADRGGPYLGGEAVARPHDAIAEKGIGAYEIVSMLRFNRACE